MSKPICLLIGMGPGISYSTAKLFGEKGFKVLMVARNAIKLKEYVQEFENIDIDTEGFSADASDFKNLNECLAGIKKAKGIPDVLVYNVSVYREASPSSLSADIAVEDFKANVGGALVAVQSFIDGMKERKRGVIFLTGGGQGLEPMHILSSLGIGKAAMRNLSFSLYKELKPFNIRVATITVNGMVEKNTSFDPDIIAEKYWQLYNTPVIDFKRELVIN
ncbi:MAG: SDR family NAD(P)-dependent oxidoreductase [Bacteroidia bacterium]|nr:SDR family NAD(P)-dependent oxidoreductase [Bacteroidia bacterium]